MENALKKLALIGLPGSGKTTFVAALYHTIQQPEEHPKLSLTELPDESKYLDEIVDRWRHFKQVGHTTDGTYEPILFKLQDEVTGSQFELSFPDVSGEDFNDQWESHLWRQSYRDLITGVDGILLFVSPTVVRPVSIATKDKIAGQTTPTETRDTNKSYDPKEAPTGVKLVELLQFIQAVIPIEKALRVGIIISAWDLELKVPIKMRCATPSRWIEKYIPLLHQFLVTNDDWIVFRIYGVSAQGGDLKDIETLKTKSPNERVSVIVDAQSCDITEPIRWLVGD